ncbi:hypothetical protein, partial [Acinetobacter pittii]
QEKECSDEYCTRVDSVPIENVINKETKKKKTKYVFAPGCSISAHSPEGVENVFKHLKDSLGAENVGAMLQCCG